MGRFKPVNVCGNCGKSSECKCTNSRPTDNIKTFYNLMSSNHSYNSYTQYNICPSYNQYDSQSGPNQSYIGTSLINNSTFFR